MLFVLFSFALCELKASNINIRLPNYCSQEESSPYQIISVYSPNVSFQSKDLNYIDTEIIYQTSSSTVAKINVKYSGNDPITTEIIASTDQENLTILVNIDPIEYLSIRSSGNSFLVNTFIPISVIAYNRQNKAFTSLNGTKIEWIADTPNASFIFCKIEDVPLKGLYRHPSISKTIIKGEKNGLSNLICSMPHRQINPATFQLTFKSPILFNPSELYVVPKAEVSLSLFYALRNEEQVKHSKFINLTKDSSMYKLESSSQEIANVSSEGKLNTYSVGEAIITARDQSLFTNVAKAVVHVVVPDNVTWEEQWLKTEPQEEPDLSKVTLFYKNKKILFPANYPFKLQNKKWKKAGTRAVKATFPAIGKSFHGVVHTCPPPTVTPDYEILRVGGAYRFIVSGGSGFFDFEYDSSVVSVTHGAVNKSEVKELKNGVMWSVHSVTSLKEGKAVIRIVDRKISGYETIVKFDFFSSGPSEQKEQEPKEEIKIINTFKDKVTLTISTVVTAMMAICAVI